MRRMMGVPRPRITIRTLIDWANVRLDACLIPSEPQEYPPLANVDDVWPIRVTLEYMRNE
jgi:hypothetical protein